MSRHRIATFAVAASLGVVLLAPFEAPAQRAPQPSPADEAIRRMQQDPMRRFQPAPPRQLSPFNPLTSAPQELGPRNPLAPGGVAAPPEVSGYSPTGAPTNPALADPAFLSLDRNRDGVIGSDEYLSRRLRGPGYTGPADSSRRAAIPRAGSGFGGADTNRDGQVTPEEFTRARDRQMRF
jgi:hypothetical protein